MPDREKVMKGLEHHTAFECSECPYSGDCHQLPRDALELLKEREARVLSLDEVFSSDECWFECINGVCGYADVYYQDNHNHTAIIYRTQIRAGERSTNNYTKTWRCWTSRPTDEQRKEVKWNE